MPPSFGAFLNKHLPPGDSRRDSRCLAVLTLALLLPFCGKAFHIDDTLYLYVAQQIADHPLDPFGFSADWLGARLPMTEVSTNPPLSNYYLAAAGLLFGWSERALHLAFLLPALAAVLLTYRLARRLTSRPLLAAAALLLTPGFLVSASTLMCDVSMLALWLWAMLLWLKALDEDEPRYYVLAGAVAGLCALTKFFGLCLVPLLGAYTLLRRRDAPDRILYLMIPVLMMAAYEYWACRLYGSGLLLQAMQVATTGGGNQTPPLRTLIALTHMGGAAFTAVTFIPVLWPARRLLQSAVPVWLLGRSCMLAWFGTLGLGLTWAQSWIGWQASLFCAGGAGLVALAWADWQRNKNADALLLALWLGGVFAFTAFVNWTVNVRTVLPLVPAAGILLARNIESLAIPPFDRRIAAALGVSALVALWVCRGDAELAGSQRAAARQVEDMVDAKPGRVGFLGHWGFQRYMEEEGFHAVDPFTEQPRSGDVVVVPENNVKYSIHVPPQFVASERDFTLPLTSFTATESNPLGAGFYGVGGAWGPLPYAFGPVPDEKYRLLTLKVPPAAQGKALTVFVYH
jgi:4-amino-4-deoxy-L-arabinose transferase-like glycosyltransferase